MFLELKRKIEERSAATMLCLYVSVCSITCYLFVLSFLFKLSEAYRKPYMKHAGMSLIRCIFFEQFYFLTQFKSPQCYLLFVFIVKCYSFMRGLFLLHWAAWSLFCV